MLTVEVGMQVFVVLMVMTVAEFIVCSLASALDDMHQMVLTKKRQGPEDVRLVDGQNPCLQFHQGDGVESLYQFLEYHDAVGRGFDAVLLEQLCTVCFVHRSAKVAKRSEIRAVE